LKAGNPNKSLAYWQGRTAEIANLKLWLNNPNIPLIGIEGIGGIGKSMLSAYIYEDETMLASKLVPPPYFAPEANNKSFYKIIGHKVIQTNTELVTENVLDMLHISFVHTFGNRNLPMPFKIHHKKLNNISPEELKKAAHAYGLVMEDTNDLPQIIAALEEKINTMLFVEEHHQQAEVFHE
jgi:hypothetical protein